MRRFLLAVVLVLFILPVAEASIESQLSSYHVVDRNVVVEHQFLLTEGDSVTLSLPIDAHTVDTSGTLQDGFVSIESQGTIIYVTQENLDKNNFLLVHTALEDTNVMILRVVLPEGAILKEDIARSVFPAPNQATTDGKSLIFIWKRENVAQGDEFSTYIRYKPAVNRNEQLIIVLGTILIIMGGISLILQKSKPKKQKKAEKNSAKSKKPSKKKEDSLLKHLKEEERAIIQVLMNKEGSCEQGTLRIVTGMSKASLSRLLSELEQRKLIQKEKRGKKNVIFLKYGK